MGMPIQGYAPGGFVGGAGNVVQQGGEWPRGKFGPGGFGPGGPGPMHGPPPPRDIATASQHVIGRHDANGDGAIDLATEVPTEAQARIGAMLAAADADGSGTVTADEIKAQMTAADTNGDGALAHDEFRAMRAATLGTPATSVATTTTEVAADTAATTDTASVA